MSGEEKGGGELLRVRGKFGEVIVAVIIIVTMRDEVSREK